MNNNYYSFYRPTLENKSFSDLNPIDCGWAKCRPSLKNIACRHNYIIHYISKGRGNVCINKKNVSVCEGEIFFIKPEQIVAYTASEEDPWEYIWIEFNGSLSKKLDEINEIALPFDSDIFFSIKNCEQYFMKEEWLASKLFELYIRIFSKSEKQNPVCMAKNYIDCSYSGLESISALSKKLKIDRHHLARIFKREIGMTMQEYLISRRMTEARRLLSAGFNVCETANAVGYNDQFVFSKAFKKYYGVSPSKLKSK